MAENSLSGMPYVGVMTFPSVPLISRVSMTRVKKRRVKNFTGRGGREYRGYAYRETNGGKLVDR
jgi:hypothetical protein